MFKPAVNCRLCRKPFNATNKPENKHQDSPLCVTCAASEAKRLGLWEPRKGTVRITVGGKPIDLGPSRRTPQEDLPYRTFEEDTAALKAEIEAIEAMDWDPESGKWPV